MLIEVAAAPFHIPQKHVTSVARGGSALPPTCVKSTLIWLNSEPVMKLAKNTMMTCTPAGSQA
jgi:hypothetical protein